MPLRFYFEIQYKRWIRWFEDIGLNPVLMGALAIFLFIVCSKSLFIKLEFAEYVFMLVAICGLVLLSDTERLNQLQHVLISHFIKKVRIIENLIFVLPFQLYLIYEGKLLVASMLIPIAVAFAYIHRRSYWNRTIPTPFRRTPFEYIIGFRKWFLFMPLIFFLITKAFQVGNYNLGVFSLILFFGLSMMFYFKSEPEYYVWIYDKDVNGFLRTKFYGFVINALKFSCIGFIALLVGFLPQWKITVFVYLTCLAVSSTIILAKYASFPREMSMPQGIFYALSVIFPPLLLLSIWVFYKKSKNNLLNILE